MNLHKRQCFFFMALATLCLSHSETSLAIDRHWIGASGNWSTAGNWSPNGVPFSTDDVLIGSVGGGFDYEVSLDQNDVVASLQIMDGRNLDTNGSRLLVAGQTTVDGNGSRLFVKNSPLATDFGTEDLTITDGASVRMDGGTLHVEDYLSIGSTGTLSNSGAVNLTGNSGTGLRVDGHLVTASSLVINQLGTSLMDLDGATGNGRLTSTGEGILTFNGTALADAFNGTMHLGRNSVVNMNFSQPWELASTGEINFSPGFAFSDFGTGIHLDSNEMVIHGMVNTGDSSSDAYIHADVILENSANVDLHADSRLSFTGTTEVNGGNYNVGWEAALIFDGPTTVRGGNFTSQNDNPFDGGVYFTEQTTWSGDATFNGYGSQSANAAVVNPTTITADRFDMDGNHNDSVWQIDSSLTVNGEVEYNNAPVQAIFNIGSGAQAGLTVNKTDLSEPWKMHGTLNLGSNPVVSNRLAGSPVRMQGLVNVGGPNTGISADTTFASGNLVNILAGSSNLKMSGQTIVQAGAAFQGLGAIVNLPSGTMILEDNAQVEVDVENDGVFRVGNSLGSASAQRFAQSAGGRLEMDIAGTNPGQFDQLSVDQFADLDGTLAISSNGYSDPATHGTFDQFALIDALIMDGEFDDVLYDEVALDWEFTTFQTYRSHEGDGLFRVVSYDNDEVSLVNYRAMLGDANGDGTVDGIDFTIWNANKFTAGTDWTTGDFNGDGVTDGADYILWSGNKFTSVGSFAMTAVPEPATGCGLLVCLTLFFARKRQ